jgi:hypothetical protein
MSFCEICNTECDLCNVPKPTLTRQTNEPRGALYDEHEECDEEPCASCLERWECDLDALKTMDEIDGLTAYHIANHEKMVDAGKRRLARETRLAAALAAEIAALEAAYGRAAAEARKAYIASYDPVADAQCFRAFQRDLSERRERRALEAPVPAIPALDQGVKRALEVPAEPLERGAYQVAKRARLEEPLERTAFQAMHERYEIQDEPFRHVFRGVPYSPFMPQIQMFRGVTYFPLEMPQIQLLERQTNDHPINFQAPRPRCLVKNCSCEESGTFPRLVKEVNGELVHY